MITRRALLAVAALLTLSLPATSAESIAFDAAAFEAAQAEGRPILVHVTAPWCGTCRAQKRVLPELLAAPEFADLVWLNVDFDEGGDTLRAFDVRHQSTMILFRGEEEVARSVGETQPDALREVLGAVLR
ncbi:MAG: thiol reductase thioredoxin [Rhodovulum sulfidophilum]|uniref:Thiol reductase thioredoxin n=1 Tax=Rhodovulum sulfidophilum TaxID=35806 RepID=A0A2W5MW88_RHOSU|nr:MAG: thiol reductase thioredoxin [Rhodovulum sulfidophilum]